MPLILPFLFFCCFEIVLRAAPLLPRHRSRCGRSIVLFGALDRAERVRAEPCHCEQYSAFLLFVSAGTAHSVSEHVHTGPAARARLDAGLAAYCSTQTVPTSATRTSAASCFRVSEWFRPTFWRASRLFLVCASAADRFGVLHSSVMWTTPMEEGGFFYWTDAATGDDVAFVDGDDNVELRQVQRSSPALQFVQAAQLIVRRHAPLLLTWKIRWYGCQLACRTGAAQLEKNTTKKNYFNRYVIAMDWNIIIIDVSQVSPTSALL